MAPTIPSYEPIEIFAGDTAIWTRLVPEYPPTDGWTLKYSFRGVGAFDIIAAASGSGYQATVSSDDSSVTPGLYEWVGFVENTATPVERHTIGAGRVVIAPQLSNVSDSSRQQHAERMVPLLQTQLEQLAASPIESYTVEQQTTMRRKMSELTSQLAIYRGWLNRSRRRGRMGGYSAVMTRR